MASKSTNTVKYQHIFTAFWEVYKEQIENNKKSLPFNFNILDAQCGTIKENSHTNILMKLLEYKNQYGYVFLKDFIEMAEFEGDFGNLKFDENVAFETEYWDKVDGVEGRIDGLIYNQNRFAIIIENKINNATNQKQQLERYIRSVLGEGDNPGVVDSSDKVYVVFLTKDGIEKPDKESINYMRDKIGILSEQDSDEAKDKSKLISGPRYFDCSYRYNILSWLESDVQPLVFQKDSSLNTGLLQYIDFLKGMMGLREGQTLLREQSKKEFDNIINKHLPGRLLDQNKYLHDFYNYLQKQLRSYQENSDNKSKIRVDSIKLLQSLVYEKAEEPMKEFMRATKEFFTSGNNPLIKEEDYLVNHHFTFYYIVIRDKNWPKGVYVGWYPAHLLKDTPHAYLFYKRNSDDEHKDKDSDDKGFIYSKQGKAWRKKYSQKKKQNQELMLPPISNGEMLKELYKKSGVIDIIGSIKA